MSILSPAPHSVNAAAPPCSVALERRAREMLVSAATTEYHRALIAMRSTHHQSYRSAWHRQLALLEAERALLLAQIGVVDAEVALERLGDEDSAVDWLREFGAAFDELYPPPSEDATANDYRTAAELFAMPAADWSVEESRGE